ncbi:WD40 repeat domain-containing serine/threonine protein kinase [Amycolatopsis pigmentata]|uniref:WD40 repeat domain-containing serine/threonine protein kinase n=1 Tax=Amycolatopsis pigmentata TaxID=450801 RepID=A0ABW5GAC6_9PSEU
MALESLAEGDPRTIGDYRLRARLGTGGMGRVYLGHTRGGRPLAIKLVRDELAAESEFRQRFRREVVAAQRVSGWYTAQVVDFDTECAQPWLATAYVAGLSLREAVTGAGSLPEHTVWLLAAGLAEALRDIHGTDLLHRDLKPSNVLLAADGPRVIDFGIARALDATQLTRTDVRIGSPQFMSPEQTLGDTLTPAADVFSLGAVLTFAATGRAPFGDGPEAALLYRVIHEQPDLAGMPDGLGELAGRCLAKTPERRPSVEEILEFCRQAGRVGTVVVDDGWLPAEITNEIDQRAAEPLPPATRPEPASGRRRRWWPAAVGSAVVMLTAGALLLSHVLPVGQSGGTPPSPASAAPPPVAVLVGGEPEKGVAVSPDGRTVAAPGKDHAVNIWNKTGQRVDVVLDGHTCDIQATAFSLDGRAVVTGSCDRTVRLWPLTGTHAADSATPSTAPQTSHPPSVDSPSAQPAPPIERQIATLSLPDGETIMSVLFDATDRAIAITRSVAGTVRIWDVLRGQSIATLAVPATDVGTGVIATVGDDRRIVIIGTGHRMAFFDLGTGRSLGDIDGEPGEIRALAVSPDGAVLATSDTMDKTVRLWDIPGKRLLGTLPAEIDTAQALAFTPDGAFLAVGGADHSVTLWDVSKRQLLHTLRGHTDSVLSLRFSSDGTLLVSGGADQTVRLWNTSGLSAKAATTTTTVPAALPSSTVYHDDFDLDQALRQIRDKGADPSMWGGAPPITVSPGPLRAFYAYRNCNDPGFCGNHPATIAFLFDGNRLLGSVRANEIDTQVADGNKIVLTLAYYRSADVMCCPSDRKDYTFTLIQGRLAVDPALPYDPNGHFDF